MKLFCKTPPSRKYSESIPIFENIQAANKLYDKGHDVIYWTARGCKSGTDYSALTLEQLEQWGCKFTRLETNYKKPNYDILIDDKAVNLYFIGIQIILKLLAFITHMKMKFGNNIKLIYT